MNNVDDTGKIIITGHILIQDTHTKEILLNVSEYSSVINELPNQNINISKNNELEK